jgi:4-amino-4-deoxy-L-arabinose transferase-like glycosyltransferase
VVSALVLIALYSIHFAYCQRSALRYMDLAFADSDMHAYLLWAAGIARQGWLNPSPFHPYDAWMRPIAPYSQWLQWWGGKEIFQESPMYAYLLALFVHNLLWARVMQAVMSACTCLLLGLVTARVSGRVAGWIAFWTAALYAPFYAYSWPFLRDGLGWFITAAVLWALSELTAADWKSGRGRTLAWAAGALLGAGFLAKETYLMLIPMALVALAWFGWRRRCWEIPAIAGLAVVLTVSPLLVRNLLVHAPLLSSSNRFAETFIQGNAGSSRPDRFVVPVETRPILYHTQMRTLPLIRQTIASHRDGIAGWIRFQCLKFLSLLDPFESPDNMSIYFMAHISPIVRLGLKYWMVLVPGVAGACLAIFSRRRRAHFWLWYLLPAFIATLFVGIPVSRYRQSLMIFLIPWAGTFLAFLWERVRERKWLAASGGLLALLLGWIAVLGPLTREPRRDYERKAEYILAVAIYQKMGDPAKAAEMDALSREAR